MFFKIRYLKNFGNFIGKQVCWSLFLIKCWPETCNLIKKRLRYNCFPPKFSKFLRAPFLQNTSGGCFCPSTTLEIPDSHYEKKNLSTGKNLLVLSKSFLVTIARTWDSLRFSVSQKVFNASTFWLALSKNSLDLEMEFVYEKMATY